MKEKLAQLNELIHGYYRLREEETKVFLQIKKVYENISNLYLQILEEKNPDISLERLRNGPCWNFTSQLYSQYIEEIFIQNNKLTLVYKPTKKKEEEEK